METELASAVSKQLRTAIMATEVIQTTSGEQGIVDLACQLETALRRIRDINDYNMSQEDFTPEDVING